MTSIYKLNSQLHELINSDIDPETIADTLEGLEGEADQKCINLIKVLRILKNEQDEIKEEKARLDKLLKVNVNKQEAFKDFVLANMVIRGINKIQDTLNPITRMKPKQVLIVLDESKIPEDYISVKTTFAPDKKRLLADLKEGKVIEGVIIGESKAGLKY